MLTPRHAGLTAIALAAAGFPVVGAAADPKEVCWLDPVTQEEVCEWVIEDPPSPGDPPPPGDPGDPGDPTPPPPEDPEPEDPPPGAGPPFAPGYYPMCNLFQAQQQWECWWPWVDGNVGELPGGADQEAAEKAIAELRLPVPEIGSAPCTDAGCMGAVGVPVWMWVGNSWATRTVTAEISTGQITATARPRHTDWTMGDGTTLRCQQGTPYSESYGWAESPDCGHVYQRTSADQPGQRYTVTADLVWDITVTGEADLEFQIATRSSTRPAIGEYQAVVTDR